MSLSVQYEVWFSLCVCVLLFRRYKFVCHHPSPPHKPAFLVLSLCQKRELRCTVNKTPCLHKMSEWVFLYPLNLAGLSVCITSAVLGIKWCLFQTLEHLEYNSFSNQPQQPICLNYTPSSLQHIQSTFNVFNLTHALSKMTGDLRLTLNRHFYRDCHYFEPTPGPFNCFKYPPET